MILPSQPLALVVLLIGEASNELNEHTCRSAVVMLGL